MDVNYLSVVIGIISALVGILIGLSSMSRNKNNDVRADAEESAMIRSQLSNINNGIESIRIDIKANEKRLMDVSERVVRVEESVSSAHKRLDAMAEKVGN